MNRPFAAFDIDGTLIRWQLYHAIADQLAKEGHIDQEAYKTMKDARKAWKRRTESSFRDYEVLVISTYEEVLQKLTFEQLDTAVESVFDEYKDQVYNYTRDLLETLKQQGYLLFAISGSQDEIVRKIAKYYGFDDYIGTVYERSKHGFTGNKIVAAHFKDQALKTLTKKHGVSYKDSFAIGDSKSDVAMMKLVEQPIAFNPEESLFEHAKEHGWKIVLERKNMVYELESKDGQYQLVKTN